MRAVLEGVAFNLRIIFEALTEQGADLEALRMIGGGIQNPILCQILADVLGIPIQRLESGEFATSLGAAVCGGVGVGLFSDFEVVSKLCPVVGTDEPDQTGVAQYNRLYPLFSDAYRSLVELFGKLADLQAELA